jgi:thioredoxin 1
MMLSVNEISFAEVVLNSPRPVLVNFWAPWCGLCRLVTPILSQVQTQWHGNLQIVNINADDNLRLANTYRLKNLPTLLLFEKGQVIYRLDSFQTREELQQIGELIPVGTTVTSA